LFFSNVLRSEPNNRLQFSRRGKLLFRVGGRFLALAVVLDRFRIEELAGGGERFGGCVAVFLTRVDVFATVDALGFASELRATVVDT
jgi:hypothetical protein